MTLGVALLAASVVALGLRALAAPQTPAQKIAIGALALLAAVVVAGVLMLAPAAEPGLEKFAPSDATLAERPAYAGSKSCRTCHPGAYATWRETYHRKMTQRASPEAIIAPFDGRRLQWQGREYRVLMEDDRFLIEMPAFGREGKQAAGRWRRPVVMTTGSHHMQAYWIWAGDASSDQERLGQALFGVYCAHCHGPNGRGGEAAELLGVGMVPEEIAPWLPEAERGHPVVRNLEEHEIFAPPRQLDDEERAAVSAFVSRLQFDGRLTQFPFVWLTAAQRWVHEETSFLQPPVPRTESEPPGDRWGESCDGCHSVAPVFSFEEQGLTASSAAVDLGIACEACHGPGRRHVEQHRNPLTRYASLTSALAPVSSTIVNPGKLEQKPQLHVCGQCHAETESRSGPRSYTPGGDLEEDYFLVRHPLDQEPPAWLAEALADEPDRLSGSFWNDGTVRVAGRDLNGLLESACTTRGAMTCLSCHRMHGSDPDGQLGPQMRTDKACLQCHQASSFAAEKHTHHAPESEGSRCYNCHMPYTTYGLLKAIRAHRVDSPDPARSARSGRPDACTLCHLDRSLVWAEEALAKWDGREPRALTAPEPFSELLHRPMSVLHLAGGDAVQRAISAWHLSWAPAREVSGDGSWAVPLLLPLLEDDYAAVRYLAGRALSSVPGFSQLHYDFVAEKGERKKMRARAEAIWSGRDAAAHDVATQKLGLSLPQAEVWIATMREALEDEDVRINE